MEESPYLQGNSQLIEKFRDLPFFSSLDTKFLKRILELSKLRKYSQGEVITTEGVRDCWIYLLISGSVRISKKGEEIAVLDNVGDTFGELAAIDGESRSATVEAINEVVLLAVDTFFLKTVEPENHNAFFSVIYRMFAEILSHRLRVTSEELANAKKEIERLKAWGAK